MDQSLAAAEASGMLSDAAGCGTLSGAGCWLPEEGARRAGRADCSPYRAEAAHLEEGRLLRRQTQSPTWSGRNKVGGAVVFLLATCGLFQLGFRQAQGSERGFAARLNTPRKTPNEQSAKATKTRGLKMPDRVAGFGFWGPLGLTLISSCANEICANLTTVIWVMAGSWWITDPLVALFRRCCC